MPNVSLTLAYDGTRYFGWQKTKTGPSIEATLQQVLETILQQPIRLNVASRTDRGVHALSQTVNFEAAKTPPLVSLNQLLPKDIAVLEVKQVPPSFHATLSCLSKTYIYDIATTPFQLPQRRLYEWHFPRKLYKEPMQEAAKFLRGTQDFKSLTNRKKNEIYTDTVREVMAIIIEEREGGLRLLFEGRNFLYKMVRNMVGLIVYAGIGKIDPSEIPTILASKDRRLAALSASAHGLTLLNQTFKEH